MEKKNRQLRYLLLAHITFCLIVTTASAIGPRVNTTIGTIEGFFKTVDIGNETTELKVFLGIPYAEPPIGDLRFRMTKIKTKKPGVFNASNYGYICPQDTAWVGGYKKLYPPSAFVVNEDCLYLNIYSPANSSKDNPKPTMVWIHGGSYLSGTGNIYDGTFLAALGDVVVVTINYRLGVLGYLSTRNQTGSSPADGNYGAFDQQAALLWVFNNIDHFGGDRSNITLFGESAGASSVSLLTLSPINNLFKRVIIESGTALIKWATAKDPTSHAKDFAAFTTCNVELSKLTECLRLNATADEILTAQTSLLATDTAGDIWFAPIIDNLLFFNEGSDVITGKYEWLNERLAHIDHLIGTNSQEGAFIYDAKMAYFRIKFGVNDTANGMPRFAFNFLVNQSAQQISKDHHKTLMTALQYSYTDYSDMNNGFKTAFNYINALSDNVFYSGIIPWAQYHARVVNASEHKPSNLTAGNTFFYYFDHRGSWMSHEPWRFGANHADEVPFVFGLPFIQPDALPEEMSLSMAMIKFWTNFAKTGDPNYPDAPEYPVTWPNYVNGEESYIRLTTDTNPSNLIGQKLMADRVAFWTNFLPNFLASFPTPTTPTTHMCPSISGKSSGLEVQWCLLIIAFFGLIWFS